MSMMIDSRQAAQKLVVNGSPVLFLDTCSLLDLMRDPTRSKFGEKRANAAAHLLSKGEAKPTSLTIILAQQVVEELAEHKDEIEKECKRVLKELDDTVARVFGIANAYGLSAGSGAAAGLSQIGYPRGARQITDRFVAASIIVKEEDAFVLDASNRVKRGIRPARRGRQSFKDCLITETYLDVTRKARSHGFSEQMLFLSTNTADYTEGSRSRLHSELEPDFQSARLDFEADFLAARYGMFPS